MWKLRVRLGDLSLPAAKSGPSVEFYNFNFTTFDTT